MFVQFKIVQVDLVKTYNFFVGAGRKASKKTNFSGRTKE